MALATGSETPLLLAVATASEVYNILEPAPKYIPSLVKVPL
jgi:hypothetical protein